MSSLNNSKQTGNYWGSQKPGSKLSTKPFEVDFAREFEKLALFVAEAWRDDHIDNYPYSETDCQECIRYVTAEMAKAGSAVGGPAGLEILTGGGSAAARKVCRVVLSKPPEK